MSISHRSLEILVERINTTLDTPKTAYTQVDKRNVANVGNYHLHGAYGGWQLVQIVNESGGVREVTQGYDSRPRLFDQLNAFLAGVSAARN